MAVINNALNYIRDNMNANCSSFLLSGGPTNSAGRAFTSFGQAIAELQDNFLVGHATVTSASGGTNNASTGSGAGGLAIIVNRNGSVFNNRAPRSTGIRYRDQISSAVNPGSQRQAVFTLLHEFGHLYGATGFESDLGNQEAVNRNNDRVWEACAGLINGAAGSMRF